MSIHVYYGDETYCLEQAVRDLRAATIAPGMESLSHKVIKNPDPLSLLETLSEVSMGLVGKTLFEIVDFDYLNKTAESDHVENTLTDILEHLATLADADNTKVVLFSSSKYNKRYKFPKALAAGKTSGGKNATSFAVETREFKQLAFWEQDKAVSYVVQESKTRGYSIHPQAAGLLVDHMGVGMQPIMNEIAKLAVFANGTITPEHVRALSPHNENTFGMLEDWVRQKPGSERFHILQDVLLKTHYVPTFGLFQSYVNNLYQMKYWQNKGYTRDEIAKRSGKHPFRLKKEMDTFARVPLNRLETLKNKVTEMEWKVKTGQLTGSMALEVLLAQ